MSVDKAKERIREALSVLEEPHVGNATNRLEAALAELGSPVIDLAWLEDKIEKLISEYVGIGVAAAVPWTDLANATPLDDLRAWIELVKSSN